MIYHFRFVLQEFLPFQRIREDIGVVKEQGRLDDDAVSYLTTAVSLLDKRGMEIFIPLHKSYNISADSIYDRLANR